MNGIHQAPRGTRFRELANRIRHGIDRGELAIGTRLPSMAELASDSGLGVNTVRRAVALLTDEGLLDCRHGSGTYVVATSANRRPRHSIGVVVPSLTYYYPSVVAGIEHAAARHNMRVEVACSSYDIEQELHDVQRLLDSGVDGLLLVPSLHRGADRAEQLARLARLRIPYVLVERQPDPAPMDHTSYVRTDTTAGGYAAVAHLASLGRRRIGYVGYRNAAPAADVYRGYRDAMHAHGLPIVDSAVLRKRNLTMVEVGTYAETCRDQRLDAVFCLGDPFAATLVRELGKVRLAVPDDVAVVSFDDEFAETAEVPLTAVAPPKFEIGRLATELLFRQLEAGTSAVPCQVRLQPRLVVRASCGALARTRNRVLAPVG